MEHTQFIRSLSQRRFSTITRSGGCRSFCSSSLRKRAQNVGIVEVGPRDGLQNEKQSIPIETKVELVRSLANTGLRTIEAGSFVSPKWVPQMANSSKILEQILGHPPASSNRLTYQWLMPNMKGLNNFFAAFDQSSSTAQSSENSGVDAGPALNTSSQDANEMPSSTSGVGAMSQKRESRTPTDSFDTGPAQNTSTYNPNEMPSAMSGADAISPDSSSSPKHEVSLFMAATETFSQRNTNCSIAESLERFQDIIGNAKARDINVRAYISVALGCPYEGPDTDPHRVAEICTELLEMGADEISVADTTGMGTPPRTRELLKTLQAAGIKNEDLALHFHDTYGQALVNTLIGLEHGVGVFDSAVGGLGGCPFSPGATGNVATEDLVNLFEGLGVKTGIDLEALSKIGDWISRRLSKPNESRAGRAILAKM